MLNMLPSQINIVCFLIKIEYRKVNGSTGQQLVKLPTTLNATRWDSFTIALGSKKDRLLIMHRRKKIRWVNKMELICFLLFGNNVANGACPKDKVLLLNHQFTAVLMALLEWQQTCTVVS